MQGATASLNDSRWARNCLLAVGLCVGLAGPQAARADLSGSYVEYDCDTCYVEWASQTVCFESHTYTTDGESVQFLWLQLPSDWAVTSVYDAGPTTCEDVYGNFGGFSWTYESGNDYEIRIAHQRTQYTIDHCWTTYCVTADAGAASGPVHVSWYYADPAETGAAPHYPGSDDGYTPGALGPADATDHPPAQLPHCDPRILIIQDTLPWGSSAWQDELTAAGYFYDEIYSNEIGFVDLDEYDLVVVSSEQDGTYHTEVNSSLTLFEDYVDAGGRLFYAMASNLADTPYPEAPFGGTFGYAEEASDEIVALDHPLVAGLLDPIGPNSFTSYGGLTSTPAQIVEITTQQGSGDATLYEYNSGLGTIVVSSQAVEIAYTDFWDLGALLPTAIDYLLGYGVWDDDVDGFSNCADNCGDIYNPFQDDADLDGIGDVCDTCTDADGDGYGDVISDTSGCPSGTDIDCDDNNASVYPGLAEWYDGADNDCDGMYDNGVMPANVLFITEVMKDPAAVGDTFGEWFELYNNSIYDMNVIGLEIHDLTTNTFTVTGDLWIPSYGQIVLGRSDDLGNNGGVTVDFEYSNFQLDNAADEIVVTHDGYELDRIEFDDGVNWPDPTGASMQLNLLAYDYSSNDAGANWCVSWDPYGQGDLGTPGTQNPQCCEDLDGDGYRDVACGGDDCNDADPLINPSITEICDGIDENCDGIIDEPFDLDLDGYTTCNNDCDDNDANVNPGMFEYCDGVDNDCDGAIDPEGSAFCVPYLRDEDGDGYGVDGDVQCLCAATYPYDTLVGGDCDDTSAAAYPGGTEICDGYDNNCDGTVDEGFDGDGDGYSGCADDCDDADPLVNPAATETCDGIDNDCDGDTDEDDAADASLWYPDLDNDGYGSGAEPTPACYAPAGYVEDSTDCDDTNAAVNPGQPEICDGLDNDCNPSTDENSDYDGDGYTACDGDCDEGDAAMSPADYDGDGYSSCDGDCDDSNPMLSPADIDGDGYSTCDGDCDDADATLDPGDADLDGITSCDGDCDDANAATYPGAIETCDGEDNDCDGMIPPNELDVDADGWTLCDGDCNDNNPDLNLDDADGDLQSSCDGDCDDADATVFQGAEEICDGIDNDCDFILGTGETDGDQDGWLICANDCDDNDYLIHPEAVEECDGIDNNCDNTIDEDDACGGGDDDDSSAPVPGCQCSKDPGLGGSAAPTGLLIGLLGMALIRRRR